MRHLLRSCGWLAGVLLAAPAALAQSLDPTFASPTALYTPASIDGMGPQQADGKRIIFGNFSRVGGQPTTSLVRLDASGSPDQAFAQQIGQVSNVFRVRAGLNGQYLLGAIGGNIVAGGLTRTEVLRLNADGSADASFDAGAGPTAGGDPGYGYDYATQPDGKVLVGGVFDSYSGTLARGLVRLNANGSLDNTFTAGLGINVSINEDVEAIQVLPGGKLLVGGNFNTFNGATAHGLMRLNADGSVDATFTTPLPSNCIVTSMVAQPDGKILLGGYLGGGTTLARLLASGDPDTGFNAPVSLGSIGGFEEGVAVLPNGQLVVIGYLNNGTSKVARLNSDGSLDITFALSAPPSTYQSVVGTQPDGSLLLGSSDGSNVYGTTETTFAKFSSAGALVASYAPRPQGPGYVRTVAQLAGGDLVVGGSFTEWNGQPVHHLVRLSSTGALNTAFAAATGVLPGAVQQVVVQPDGQLLVNTYQGLARYSATGNRDFGFTPFYSNVSTQALAVQPDGRILVAFNQNGPYFGRLNANGSLDGTFTRTSAAVGGTASTVQAIAVQPDGKIVVAENYVVGTSRPTYLVRYQSTGAQDASFVPARITTATNIDGPSTVYGLVLQPDGKPLVIGRFNRVAGAVSSWVARLTTTGAYDATFTAPTYSNGVILSLALQPNGRVLLGGSFSFAGGAYLQRLLANGQADASFSTQSSPSSVVSCLLVQPDGGIVVGGSFNAFGGQPAQKLIRLTAPNVLSVAAPAAVAARTEAWPVPAHDLLRVQPDASAQPQQVELLDALGRVLRQQPLASPGEVALDVRGLPAGAYLLRVHYAQGSVVRRLTVE